MQDNKMPLERVAMINTRTVVERPNIRRFEFEQNPVGANYIIINQNTWTVHDLGFGSRQYIGCKVKLLPGGKRIAIYHDGGWIEIHADLKRI